MAKSLISVVIPVYNGEQFIASTIENINSQQYQPIEIIVVDDGSTDATLACLKKMATNIKTISQTNQGPSAARNRGFAESKGIYIAFLDCDDLWPANKLIDQANYLDAHSEVDLVQGLIEKINLNSGKSEFSAYPLVGNTLFRRSAFERIGMFDETMRYAEDTDWFLRAFESGLIKVIVNKVALYYRIHAENMTKNEEMVNRGFLHFIKKHKDRRLAHKQPNKSTGKIESFMGFDEIQLNAIQQFKKATKLK